MPLNTINTANSPAAILIPLKKFTTLNAFNVKNVLFVNKFFLNHSSGVAGRRILVTLTSKLFLKHLKKIESFLDS